MISEIPLRLDHPSQRVRGGSDPSSFFLVYAKKERTK